jgi:lipoic acid synthetase
LNPFSPLKKKIVLSESHGAMKIRLRKSGLQSVCEEARCPNASECFQRGTVTFLLMGPACTRSCRFCSVRPAAIGLPPPDSSEIERMVRSVRELGLSHAVLTSVTRDDLPDGGAEHLASAVRMLKKEIPGLTVELLFPDFRGDVRALDLVLDSGCDVFNHNMETVRRLSVVLRPQASYERSLEVLRHSVESRKAPVKSGFMVGLGETREEIRELLGDLAATGISIVTIGQYFQPGRDRAGVVRMYPDEEFDELAREGRTAGIPKVASGRFVRSSYRAAELFLGQNPEN